LVDNNPIRIILDLCTRCQ